MKYTNKTIAKNNKVIETEHDTETMSKEELKSTLQEKQTLLTQHKFNFNIELKKKIETIKELEELIEYIKIKLNQQHE